MCVCVSLPSLADTYNMYVRVYTVFTWKQVVIVKAHKLVTFAVYNVHMSVLR